ncbi:MAG TPA: hypothetical protein VNJ12_01175 [Candidatus Dormibacteraeota bacterium]|nr:hypothetical protein [Candidatus Dormibacteraeota bacterium]
MEGQEPGAGQKKDPQHLHRVPLQIISLGEAVKEAQSKDQVGNSVDSAPHAVVHAEPGSEHGQKAVQDQQQERGLADSNSPWGPERVQ